MVWASEDTDFTAIKDVFFGNSPLELAVMDGLMTDPDSEGLRASFSVFSFTRNEALEEAILADVSMKPTYAANAPEWINGVGP